MINFRFLQKNNGSSRPGALDVTVNSDRVLCGLERICLLVLGK
ncbi:hypothetical protein PSYMO_35677 [Pseudomonas amygdali pv. mori str. 301020]|uniref:Uncharacterized protein n=1 Tax=Pseudomonas amygdali pv. mori str. 301020 TaxID=629261 RepID=A0A656GLA0_PSEA0|nr:hypothetical protein PSYMO_35677 [Pseudomonas amygdali pv. mori str. 301020]